MSGQPHCPCCVAAAVYRREAEAQIKQLRHRVAMLQRKSRARGKTTREQHKKRMASRKEAERLKELVRDVAAERDAWRATAEERADHD